MNFQITLGSEGEGGTYHTCISDALCSRGCQCLCHVNDIVQERGARGETNRSSPCGESMRANSGNHRDLFRLHLSF